jgi:hypothetical protein
MEKTKGEKPGTSPVIFRDDIPLDSDQTPWYGDTLPKHGEWTLTPCSGWQRLGKPGPDEVSTKGHQR